MKNFVQPGNVVTAIAPTGGVVSGQGVLIGSLFGVATTDAEEDASFELALTGVYDLPSAGAITAASKAFWDNTAKKITATALNNQLVGVAVRDAGALDPTCRIRLNGAFGFPVATS